MSKSGECSPEYAKLEVKRLAGRSYAGHRAQLVCGDWLHMRKAFDMDGRFQPVEAVSITIFAGKDVGTWVNYAVRTLLSK